MHAIVKQFPCSSNANGINSLHNLMHAGMKKCIVTSMHDRELYIEALKSVPESADGTEHFTLRDESIKCLQTESADIILVQLTASKVQPGQCSSCSRAALQEA